MMNDNKQNMTNGTGPRYSLTGKQILARMAGVKPGEEEISEPEEVVIVDTYTALAENAVGLSTRNSTLGIAKFTELMDYCRAQVPTLGFNKYYARYVATHPRASKELSEYATRKRLQIEGEISQLPIIDEIIANFSSRKARL